MSAMKQVYDELNRVRNSLRRRVKLPELEVAVSRDLGVKLKADYIRDCRDFCYERVWYAEHDPESKKPDAERPA